MLSQEEDARRIQDLREIGLSYSKQQLWEKFYGYLYDKCEAIVDLLNQRKVVKTRITIGDACLPVWLMPSWEMTGEARWWDDARAQDGYITVAIMYKGAYPLKIDELGIGDIHYLREKFNLNKHEARDLLLYLMTIGRAIYQHGGETG